MLAHPSTKNEIDWNYSVFVQPKLDGIRCLFTKNGAFSRHGKKIMTVEHIEHSLKPFFDSHPDVVLDGEIYNHALKSDFERIISIARKTVNITDETRKEAEEMLQFHCYDAIIGENFLPEADNFSFLFRLGFIELNIGNDYDYVKVVDTQEVFDQDDIDLHHLNYKAAGYEGSIIRLNGIYEHKRSKFLIKKKDFIDFEATVTGFVEGKGKLAGKLGKFEMIMDNGKRFGCPASGFTFQHRADLWNNRDAYIGTTWTVECFELTKRGVPRFPVLKAQRDYE